MLYFLLRRLSYAILVVLGVTLVTFCLFHFVGGDPVLMYAGKNASAETIAQLRHELGTDQPIFQQYLSFVQQTFSWQWGESWSTHQSVTAMIAEGVGASLSLTVPAYFVSILMALFLSLFVTALKNSIWDRILSFLCYSLMSISFLIFIIYGQKLLAFDLNLFPVFGWDPSWQKRWMYITLPALIYIVATIGPKILLFRAALINEASQDYVRTAYAKGLSSFTIYSTHILKNAAIPIATLITSQMPSLITGSLLLEAYFGIPGIGGLLLKSIQGSDFPVIKALTICGSLLYIIFNLLNDLFIFLFDSRTEFK